MKETNDMFIMDLDGDVAFACKHCGGVTRGPQQPWGKVGAWTTDWIEDHKLTCGWGHGPYQPIPGVQQRLESRLRQEKEGQSTQER